MSVNFMFGFSVFLLILVAVNLYFFYMVSSVKTKPAPFSIKRYDDVISEGFPEILEYLHYLAPQYRNRNSRYLPIQRQLIKSFNTSWDPSYVKDIWNEVSKWANEYSLFPDMGNMPAMILHAITHSKVALVDNAPKGTQLKLLLVLEGKQKIFFKPKRYDINHVIKGDIYAGYDRHNSEVFGYYLALVLNFKWVAPSVIQKFNVVKDILPYATQELKNTIVKRGGEVCIYGSCFYCRPNETVCGDDKGEIEGAAILYLDKRFRINKSPWRRSYTKRKMEWETDENYCAKASPTLTRSIILDLIDISIFDFLIQNGDRHRYEVYKNKIVLLDNGKGLGNPYVDVLDILAPLYQCCILRHSTWQHLELLSGGVLTETIKALASFQKSTNIIATEDHYNAVERRLTKVYATVQMCIGKHGSSKVFK